VLSGRWQNMYIFKFAKLIIELDIFNLKSLIEYEGNIRDAPSLVGMH
jgi:hypothetical protein